MTAMPKFLFNIRLTQDELPYLASPSIITPLTEGFRGLVRKFPDELSVREALAAAGIEDVRYSGAIDGLANDETRSFEIDLNEAQKLSLIQIDTTE